MPHIEWFNECCIIENIEPPPNCTQQFIFGFAVYVANSNSTVSAARINVKGLLYLPDPVVATGAHIKCSAQAAHIFTQELEMTVTYNAPLAAIHGGAEMGVGLGKKNSPLLTMPHSQVCLDWIKLEDEVLPKLYVLVQTVHSS